MSGIKVDYGGVAQGAKENFVPFAEDKESFIDLSVLQKENNYFLNYGNPCDVYSVVLDGNTLPVPDETESQKLGWWSSQTSGNDGVFENPIVLTLTATELYASSGITLTFDTYNNIYATDINIKWYNGENLLADVDFQPNSPFYFCYNKVEFYNKLKITFKKINMPYNRLKLYSVEYGMKISFYGDELKSAKIIQELDPISSQMSINTFDFTLESKRNIEYSFEERQPITVYFNDKVRATSFVKSANRKSQNTWSIQSEDYIGLLDGTPYYGGIYNNYNAVDLLRDIFTVAKVPYTVDDSLSSEVVTGYIPYTTCREALKQVVFAINAVADTSNSDVVKVFVLGDSVTQTIPLKRIMQGQKFADQTRMTAVEVTSHTYVPVTDESVAYEADKSGEGESLFVNFSNPLHDLNIVNGDIVESSTNYAIINARSGCVLKGQGYEHTTKIKRKANPLVLASDSENIVSVQNATLVSNTNIDKVLEKCYNYYSKQSTVNLKIVEGKHESKNIYALYGVGIYGAIKYGAETKMLRAAIYDETTEVGQVIESETQYLGEVTGRITKQTYNLNGGIIIKDTTLRKV